MEAIGTLLTLVGVLAFFAGLISLIRPLRFLRIGTRKQAAAVVGGGFVVFMVGGAFLPTPDGTTNGDRTVAVSATAGDFSDSDTTAGTLVATTQTTVETSTTATEEVTTSTLAPATTQAVTTTTTLPVTTTTAAATTTTARLGAGIEAAVRNVLADQYQNLALFPQANGGVGVAVEMEMSDNLTMSLIAGGFKLDAGEVIMNLYTGPHARDIAWISVEGFFPLTDQYGNTELGQVVEIRFEGADAARVNWDYDESTLKLDILPGLYDWRFIHPELSEHLP